MSKHTPGPWALVRKDDPIVVSCWSIQIGEVALPFFPYKRIYSEDRTKSGLVIDDEKMANARLIAAAPDLLAALKMALEAPDDDRSWEDDAIAAIKKADPFWVDPAIVARGQP